MASDELIITWCMQTTTQSTCRERAGRREVLLQPRQLAAAGVAADVDVAAVLQADVVVLQHDHVHRADVKEYQRPASSASVSVDGTSK